MGWDQDPPRDDVELVDNAWDQSHSHGGGRSPKGLLLLVLLAVVAVAVVVTQLQPDRPTAASPTASSSASAGSPTSAASTDSTSETDATASTAAPPAPSSSARPGRPPVVTQLDQPLLGITDDWELFVRRGEEVLRIEPARGRVSRTFLKLRSTGPVSILATKSGAVIRPFDSVPGYFVPDGKPARLLPGKLSAGGPLLAGPDPDHVWMLSDDGGGKARLVGLDGTATRTVITVPDNAGWQVMSDGAGYLTTHTPGGYYDLRPEGAHRITAGTLIATGPTGWLAVECDDRNGCAQVLIDGRTGPRRTVPGQGGDAGGWDSGAIGSISPDGSTAVVTQVNRSSGPVVTLLDLASGRRHLATELGNGQPFYDGSGFAWSPDSRWLFAVDDGGVLAVDVRNGKTQPLGISFEPTDEMEQPEGAQLAIRVRG